MNDREALAALHKRERRKDRHHQRNASDRPFAGADGEGGNWFHVDSNGVVEKKHHYMLLRVGDAVLETGKPLRLREMLQFLANLPTTYQYVSYFFDYDVTMILRELPVERLKRLLDVDTRRIPESPASRWPVDYGRYQFDYTPHKEFRIRKWWVTQTGTKEYGKWVVISDTGSNFQCSFVAALEQWFGVTEKREQHNCSYCGNDGHEFIPESENIGKVIAAIIEGKRDRESFGAVTEEEREYNRLECIMLVELMNRFKEKANSLDIRPGLFQGPGRLVAAVMKREGQPNHKDFAQLWDRAPGLQEFANSGYYGGRFECGIVGDIPGPIYQYDINSAYAATYSQLPCLIHGEWRRFTGKPKTPLYVANVHFRHKRNMAYYTLPIRTKTGTLIFPREGNGVYWSPELDIARQYATINWRGGWEYTVNCSCTYFDWVWNLYRARKEMGKDNAGRVLKLVLASVYGKLTQSVGAAPYSNPVWASLIVSHVRSTLISAALAFDYGSDVCMLATDGLFCRNARELPCSAELGEWDIKIHDSMTTVQSGLYFIPGQKPKTRGTPMRKVMAHRDDFRRVWQDFLDTGNMYTVPIKLTQFIGLRLALAWNKPELAGVWLDVTKEIAYDWTSKRVFERMEGRHVLTGAPEGSAQLETIPYSRAIGGIYASTPEQLDRLMASEQPEWGAML